MASYLIKGAQILTGDEIIQDDLAVEGGQISAIGSDARGDLTIDGAGLLLAPGLVDIHGDAFERQIMARPGVFFDIDLAFLDTDRQLAANGITTAYHALTLSWEPGLRSVERGAEVIDGLTALEPRLTVDHRVQLRWETFASEAEALIEETVASATKAPSIAFNDHTTMMLRAKDMRVQDRPLVMAPDDLIASDDPVLLKRCLTPARRSDMTVEAYRDMLVGKWSARDKVEDGIARMAKLGAANGLPMLSHDDSFPEMRQYWTAKGAKIAEFPMSKLTAEDAKSRDEWVVYGAPNAVRGGSHIGSPGTADMVEAGLCDVVASDYYYPAMLAGIAKMHAENRASLPALWKTVSTNPAKASGLTDRGEIAIGKRADLVLIDWPEGAPPAIAMTLSGGHIAHLRGDLIT